MCTAPGALTRFSCARLFLLDHVEQRVWYAQVLYLPPRNKARKSIRHPLRDEDEYSTHRAATNVALFDFPKTVAIGVGLVYFAKCDVHKVIAVDEMSVECFSIFELDQLGEVGKR
jgi:hypothetical protein